MQHWPTDEQAAIIHTARTTSDSPSALIPLSQRSHRTRGKYSALVDQEDYERLIKYPWTARVSRSGTVYAIRREYRDGVKKCIWMHNEVLQREIVYPETPIQADHKNKNALDNRKENLREVTPTQNAINTINAEEAKGYFYHRTIKHYIARWRKRYVGCFKTEAEAAAAIAEAKNAYAN